MLKANDKQFTAQWSLQFIFVDPASVVVSLKMLMREVYNGVKLIIRNRVAEQLKP
jgi:hypothetical protein